MQTPLPLIPLPVILDSSRGDLAEQTGGLSQGAGAFCLAVAGRVTYLSSALNLQRRVARTVARLARLRSGQEPPQAVAIRCWETGSKLHTSLLLYQLAKQYFPGEYLQRVHLRMPWFVSLLTRDPFPRLLVTNRIPQGCRPVIGPFAQRDSAQLYEQELQSAFLLRRCTEVLDPHPEHRGCIYGEINQCLRPCQGAVDTARYLAEAADVSRVLAENGGSTLRVLTTERDGAMAAMDFEGAARIHKRLEKLKSAKDARDPVVTNVDNFNGVALVREAKSQQVQIIPMVQGYWRGVVSFDLEASGDVRQLESRLRQYLGPAVFEAEESDRDRLEDLALFARWYYSSWREGVWISFLRLDDPPYRKMARSLQKLLTSERAEKELSVQGP